MFFKMTEINCGVTPYYMMSGCTVYTVMPDTIESQLQVKEYYYYLCIT